MLRSADIIASSQAEEKRRDKYFPINPITPSGFVRTGLPVNLQAQQPCIHADNLQNAKVHMKPSVMEHERREGKQERGMEPEQWLFGVDLRFMCP